MVQRCIDALAGTGVDGRHPARPAPPTCSPTNLGIPKDLDEAVAHRPARRPPPPRRRHGQRRALRGDGRHRLRRADDPRRRPRAEGPRRPARLRRGPAPRTSAVAPRRGRRSASTARSGSTATASCVLVGNVGTILGGIDGLRRRPRPTTARSRSASSPPKGSCSGPGPSAALALGNAERSPFVQTTSATRHRRHARREATPYELDGGDRADGRSA